MRRALLLAVLLCGLLAPAAQAGQPFTVGEGQDPHLIVEPAGDAHVVWHDDRRIHYCRIARGVDACAAQQSIEAGLELGADSTFLVRGAGATLHWVMPHYVNGRTYMWTSPDNGTTWGPRTQIYKFGGGTDATEPVLGPQPGQLSLATWNPSSRAFGVALDGSEAEVETTASLSNGASSQYDLQLAPTDDGGLVAVSNDLANAFFFRLPPGADPSDQAAWSGPTLIGPGKDTRVAGGPGGAYMLSTVSEPGGSANMEIRKWTGSAFGPPTVIDEYGYINDIHVSPSGGVAAIYRVNGDPHRLRLLRTIDDGENWTSSTIALDDAVMADMDVALGDDRAGYAVYEGGSGSTGAVVQIRVADTEPVDDGTMSDRTTSNVGGAELRLDAPGGCVARDGRFSARLSFRRFPRPGTFVNVKRAEFFIGSRLIKRDKTPPFIQNIRIPNPVAGRFYTLKVKAYIKRRGQRRLQVKTVKTRVWIC